MKFIDGIKVSETEKLKAQNIDPVEVGEVGVDPYLKQILEYDFFHGDPHPGNIFVLLYSGKICFIDFGIKVTFIPNDKESLGNILLYFLRKDVNKIICVLEKIVIKTEISDYKKLESDLYELVEAVSNTPIQNIRMNTVLRQFKNVLYENKATLPHYIYMLMRALGIIGGVDLKLDTEFNITTNLEPFMANISRKKFSLKRLLKKNWTRVYDISTLVGTLPDGVNSIINKIKDGKLTLIYKIKDLEALQHSSNKAYNRLVFSIIIAAFSIESAVLVIADMPPLVYGVPLSGGIGFLASALLGPYIIISIFSNSNFNLTKCKHIKT